MKTRTGFVSNSSSTSFAIIGVCDEKSIEKLAKAEKIKFCYNEDDIEEHCDDESYDFLGYGTAEGDLINFYGDSGIPKFAGIDAERILQDMSIKEARKYFVKMVKEKLGVIVKENDVDFYCGDASN